MLNETSRVESDSLTLDQGLELMAQENSRLEEEIEAYTESRTYPDWLQASFDLQSLKDQLKDERTDPLRVSDFYSLYKGQMHLKHTIKGYDTNIDSVSVIESMFGSELIGKAFSAEDADGPLHRDILNNLQASPDNKKVVTAELNILKEAYQLEMVTDLLGIGGDEYSNSVRANLLSHNSIKWMRYIDEKKAPIGTPLTETQINDREWMRKALSAAASIIGEEADNYIFSASRRGGDSDSILSVIDRFDTFGIARIRALSEFTGIYGVGDYSIKQLKRMEDLMQHPEESADALANHDVTIVMTNRVGDHNGVMKDVAADFDDSDRVLFFEIESMSDIYRNMLLLKKIGIKPSTLVLAAHSAPGQFMVSDERNPGVRRRDIATIAGRNLVKLLMQENQLDTGDRGFSLHGMSGMARIVGNFMMPSRGIDDYKSDVGRKKIIFQACYSATEQEVVDVNEEGDKYKQGMESMISQLGNDLIDMGAGSGIDIYGAPGGIQIRKSSGGVKYTSQVDPVTGERQPLQAERVSLDDGRLKRQRIDEVLLHKV